MSDGPYCPKCEMRCNYHLDYGDLYSDTPHSEWSCSSCNLRWIQKYKPFGKPILIEEEVDTHECALNRLADETCGICGKAIVYEY